MEAPGAGFVTEAIPVSTNLSYLDELKSHQKAKLESQKANDVKRDYYEALVKQIRDNAKIDLAKEIIDGEVEAMEENMLKQIEQQGLTMEKYLQITGQTHDQLHEQMAKEAADNVRSVLVLEKIAEIEKITVEDDEIEFELAKIADQYKMPLEEVKKVLKDSMDRFRADVRSRRIQEFIVNNND